MASGATAGSSRAFRLDPHSLPVRGSGRGEASFIVDRERAIVRVPLRAGPAMTLTVPLNAYSGVAVRMAPSGEPGAIRVTVELLHADPKLTLVLIAADQPEDVAADWQAWGKALNLPLLVVGQDGSVSAPLEHMGSLTVGRPKSRRRHSFFAGRRPRFLTRRKTGHTGPRETLSGREIIARS